MKFSRIMKLFGLNLLAITIVLVILAVTSCVFVAAGVLLRQ